ncbi:MAG TPA: hypothetical protein VIE64_03100 [Solirubrobacterales bacterium]|jgi:hypothetical protein
MEGSATGRIALFLAVSALLVLASIAFSRGSDPVGTGEVARNEQGAPGASDSEQELIVRLEREQIEVERASRRFLDAFLRYEVGEQTPAVRRTLRTTATPEFARQLLASPPRRPPAGSFPPRAALSQVNVTFASSSATLVVVDGTAMRAGFPEEFGFAFTRTFSGWRASGPAE